MATLQSVLDFARTQSQTDSNGLTDANGIIFANEALLDFRRKLMMKGVDAAQIQEAYRDMTAGTGTYLYPTNPQFWFLKAIELDYSGTGGANYKMANQVDVSNIPGQQSFSWLRANASTQSPYFDDHGDWYEIFPTPQAGISAGIRMIGYILPTEFTSTSNTLSYPESLDYRILGYRVAANYEDSLTPGTGEVYNQRYHEKVEELATTLARGSQQPIQATPVLLTGWEF